MLIAFNSLPLKKICESEKIALKYFDKDTVEKIFNRVSDLLAARNIFELPIGSPRVSSNMCIIDISDEKNIIIKQNYPTKNGKEELYHWKTVQRIKIMRIANVT